MFAFPGGPGGLREVRGAGRNHFHLSWYLIVPGITSCGQKPWGAGFLFTVYDIFVPIVVYVFHIFSKFVVMFS